MDRHVRLDAHASSCTLAVLTPSGKRVGGIKRKVYVLGVEPGVAAYPVTLFWQTFSEADDEAATSRR